MTRRTRILLVLGGLFGCAVLGVAAALLAALHSPRLVTYLGRMAGYEIVADAVSLSPNLSGSIAGLRVKSMREDGPILVATSVTAKNSLDLILRGEIDSLVLQNPKLTYKVSTGSAGTTDLSFLEKLPNIRLLEIRNGEVLLGLDGGRQARLTGVNLTVKDFSSKTGGSIVFRAGFTVAGAAGQAVEAVGRIAGSFQLTGAYPRPYGKGTVELIVDSGKYSADNKTLTISALTIAADLAYERGTDALTINSLHGQGKNLGRIQATARAVLRGDMPWSARLSVGSIDFAQVFEVLKPVISDEYRGWTMQGSGAVETDIQGKLAGSDPSWNGTVAFSFQQGGFSSPDGTTAAQGVTGKLVLKLAYAAAERKLAFNAQGEQRDGEYLWGTYYVSLAGRQATVATDGTLFLDERPHLDLAGRLDAFQTGTYTFALQGGSGDWGFQASADISHERVIDTLLREYLKAISPSLGSLSLTGRSVLEAAVRRSGTSTAIVGTYRMAGGQLDAPGMPLSIRDIEAELPFDLVYPSSAGGAPPSPVPGFLHVQGFQRKRLAIDDLRVPLVVTRNALNVPEPVRVPFFGGQIQLYGLQVDDLLLPTRYRFGIRIDNVDLGRMTRRLVGTEYPGRIDADFGTMRYENNRVASEGKAVVAVFGGEIEATNLFAEALASPLKRWGGDIVFRHINLEEVTRKIAIGKMAGLIQGSLRNFVMEYGEPASFVLEIASVAASDVEQTISTEAIENISILGTGAGGILNRGITQFFKEYPYSRIGLRCVLRNDQFTVNGTIHEGGTEYLVRRGFLRGVDVINRNPDNVISFRDMEERIQRIFHASAAEVVPGR